MKKNVILCDCCGKEVTSHVEIKAKGWVVLLYCKPRKIDICNKCWDKIRSEVEQNNDG